MRNRFLFLFYNQAALFFCCLCLNTQMSLFFLGMAGRHDIHKFEDLFLMFARKGSFFHDSLTVLT